MNRFLPTKEELVPITNSKETFYDCGFNISFDELDFKSKLQVVNDLVRQSILTKVCNNPETENINLIGNCHTACKVSIEYLKELGIGTNYRIVLARRKSYQPSDITTKHALVLVDDDKGETYQFDATPFVGDGYGKVVKLSTEKIYEEYIEVNETIAFLIKECRRFMYYFEKRELDKIDLSYYLDLFEYAKKYPILNGFISYCYKLLSTVQNNQYDKDEFLKKSISLNPYTDVPEDRCQTAIANKRKMALRQIKKWQEELYELLKEPNKNERRQLELAQNIIQEMKLFDSSYEKYLDYSDYMIPYSHLTPRFFAEEGLNVATIKASAYHLGVRGTIRESILKRGRGAIGEYFTNLSTPTKETGLKPILYSHPLGDEYERSMNGPADIFLVKMSAEKLAKIKKQLRSEVGKNIINREVIWNDGQPILWHPFVTNLVHSTDNASEAALHYLMGYPEHQVMTRFMYPNLKLEKVLKK